MIDANDLINRLKEQHYKKGYKIDDKEEIKLVNDTINRLGMSISNFVSQLQGLTMIKSTNPKEVISGYHAKTNTINYVEDEHLIHELFHVASTKPGSTTSGIVVEEDDYRSNYGLNEGITDYYSEIAKNDVDSFYPFEKTVAESLSFLFGKNIFNGYFNNSYDEFINAFPEEARIEIIDIISNLDEYYDLSQSVYSGDSFPEDIETLAEVTDSIVSSLYSICELSDKEQEDLVSLLEMRCNSVKMQPVREMIQLDNAIENISSRTM